MLYQLTYITCKDVSQARSIANILLEKGLVACCNVIPGIISLYRWNGAMEEGQEVLLLAKSKTDLFPQIEKVVKNMHSYECPCITSLPIDNGSESFLNWIDENVQNP